jgi:hypothetical protein
VFASLYVCVWGGGMCVSVWVCVSLVQGAKTLCPHRLAHLLRPFRKQQRSLRQATVKVNQLRILCTTPSPHTALVTPLSLYEKLQPMQN